MASTGEQDGGPAGRRALAARGECSVGNARASSVATLLEFVFFFSSRGRHTRCLSDWSSDVCSSDLFAQVLRQTLGMATGGNRVMTKTFQRSEERRGGERGRTSGVPRQLKNKKQD